MTHSVVKTEGEEVGSGSIQIAEIISAIEVKLSLFS